MRIVFYVTARSKPGTIQSAALLGHVLVLARSTDIAKIVENNSVIARYLGEPRTAVEIAIESNSLRLRQLDTLAKAAAHEIRLRTKGVIQWDPPPMVTQPVGPQAKHVFGHPTASSHALNKAKLLEIMLEQPDEAVTWSDVQPRMSLSSRPLQLILSLLVSEGMVADLGPLPSTGQGRGKTTYRLTETGIVTGADYIEKIRTRPNTPQPTSGSTFGRAGQVDILLLMLMNSNLSITTRAIAEYFGVSKPTAYSAIKALIRAGLIQEDEGPAPAGVNPQATRYELTEFGRQNGATYQSQTNPGVTVQINDEPAE